MEGGLDKDPSGWKKRRNKVKGIKLLRSHYTLDKVLLKVDLQTLRMDNIKKVCRITI